VEQATTAAAGQPATDPASEQASALPLTVTLAQMARAFEAWERGYRAEPSKFLTQEQCAAAEVSELSADRAAYFHELLRSAL